MNDISPVPLTTSYDENARQKIRILLRHLYKERAYTSEQHTDWKHYTPADWHEYLHNGVVVVVVVVVAVAVAAAAAAHAQLHHNRVPLT